MRVLEIKNDLDYQSVATEHHEFLSSFATRQDKPIGNFQFPEYYVNSPKELVGNFYNYSFSMLAFDNIAHNALSYEVGAAGEQYPLTVDDLGTLTLLNITEVCDALDHDKSLWREEDNGEKYIVLKYEFIREKITTKSSLFKMPENNHSKLFTVTNMPDHDGDFYARYVEAGLTGLTFNELWSDEC